MADEKTYLIRWTAWLGRAIGDASTLLADDFATDQLGLYLPPAVSQAPSVVAAVRRAEVASIKVSDGASELESVAASEDELQILAAILTFGAALVEFFVAIDDLIDAVEARITPANLPDPDHRATAQAFAETLAKKLADWVIASTITEYFPDVAFYLKLAGLLEWTKVDRDIGLTRGHIRKALRLDRFNALITDPVQHFQDTLGWGTSAFDPTGFFVLARQFFQPEDDIEVGVQAGEPFIRGCILVRRDSTVTPPGLFLALFGDFTADLDERRALSPEWDAVVRSNLRMSGGIAGRLQPPLTFSLTPQGSGAAITGELRGFVERNAAARPFDVIGGTGLLSISANNVSAGVGMRADWNTSTNTATFDPLLFADVDGLTLRIGSSEADSFIGSLLAAADIQGEFDLGLEWTASTGLRVTASGGIEIALPIHKQLGPIEIVTIYVSLRILPDGTLALELSTALNGRLGPLSAAVDRIGAEVDFRFASGTEGTFGPFDVDLHFKPPNGIGLSIDAGVIVGGGYLFIDEERGEYAGALELTFSNFLSLKAIGLISTKMPDGSSGFSLLIIITAEFGSGLQLGYGFTLLAVGGLLGLNRTMRFQALLDGVRSGAVEGVMFPRDIIANAPRIISDLRNFFPPQSGTFLIGPMAKLGWGTPTLISVSLGIIIQLPPGNIAILGVLKVVLPAEDAPVLKLQVNFVGAIEFDRKRIYFFAALFESRVVFLTIDGEMGLLVAWGDDANFVVSVGGFHPSFAPPPLPFPSPARISVSLINTSAARVRIEGYFAVTSNTVQFGARADMFFGFNSINVSGHLAFDALFQFSPFYFIITISASFSLKVFGRGLFSVRIRGSLEGPTPWRARGTGSISFFFFSIDADFDVTWGERETNILPPVSVLPLLKGELEKKENWRALLPASNNLLVTLRKLPEDETLVLHPVGVLRVAQRAVPLELKLDKVGNQKPSDVNRLTVAVSGGGLARKADALEQFAPAQFQNFSDSEKLSRPAYAKERAGLEISAAGAEMRSAKMVRRVVRYEEIILDNNFKRFARKYFDFTGSLFTFFLRGAAVTKSDLSYAAKQKLHLHETKVQVDEETYTVAFQSNNRAYSTQASFASEAGARDFLAQEVAKNPNLAQDLHVIPSYERAA